MKITKTENGYLLEDPQSPTEAQALEEFVERLREGDKEVKTVIKAGESVLACRV